MTAQKLVMALTLRFTHPCSLHPPSSLYHPPLTSLTPDLPLPPLGESIYQLPFPSPTQLPLTPPLISLTPDLTLPPPLLPLSPTPSFTYPSSLYPHPLLYWPLISLYLHPCSLYPPRLLPLSPTPNSTPFCCTSRNSWQQQNFLSLGNRSWTHAGWEP